jgi:hypothetical protein
MRLNHKADWDFERGNPLNAALKSPLSHRRV